MGLNERSSAAISPTPRSGMRIARPPPAAANDPLTGMRRASNVTASDPASGQGGSHVRRAPRALYLKVRDRELYEFALASVAKALRVDDGAVREVRLALGGVGTGPGGAALRVAPGHRDPQPLGRLLRGLGSQQRQDDGVALSLPSDSDAAFARSSGRAPPRDRAVRWCCGSTTTTGQAEHQRTRHEARRRDTQPAPSHVSLPRRRRPTHRGVG
jgi:hypothetical protein